MTGDDAARPAGQHIPQSAATGAFRVADLEIFDVGDGLWLVYARDSGAAGCYRAQVVNLLVSCREFRTVEQHVRAFADAGSAGPEAFLHRELTRLARAGFLVSEHQLRTPADAGPAGEPAPISSVCFPTRDRGPVLRRAITGYAKNCQRYGRTVDFVVSDDSGTSGGREACQAMLKELAGLLGIEIYYAGSQERSAFISRLADTTGIPADVARFGCLPGGQAGFTIGANRNTLLLHTVGEQIFCADDDTVCRLALPPDSSEGLVLDPGANPLQLWFFRHRQEALTSVRYVEDDLLAQHSRYLGRAPAPMLAAAGSGSFRRADPALLRRVRAGPGLIRVTANGVVGDCGWDNPDFSLVQEGATFARLVRSRAEFDIARRTRDMIQAVTQATITHRADPKFAMCMGLDNTGLLPPFPPAGRAEEVAFGAILTGCFRDTYAAHLPLLAQHDPAETKQFSPAGPYAMTLGTWLPACMSRFDPGLAAAPAARLRGLGQFLTDLGGLPDDDFDEFTRLVMWESASSLIGELESRLASPDPAPSYWARDARRLIARARRNALVPVHERYAAAGGRGPLKRLIEQFGQLLIWWPAMIEAAGRLRAQGDRPARPVRELS